MTIYQLKSEYMSAVRPKGQHDRKRIREAIGAWMLNTISKATRNGRMTALNKLAKFAEFVDAYEVVGKCCEMGHQWTTWLLLRFREHLLEGGSAGTSVNTYMANLQSIFKFLNSVSFVAGEGCHPVDWVVTIRRLPGVERTRDVKALPKGEARARFRKISQATLRDKRDKAIISLFMDAGLRVSEVLHLELNDWDAKEKVLYVKRKGRASKAGVPLADYPASLLDDYIKELLKRGTPKVLFFKVYGPKDETWGKEPCRRNWLYTLCINRMGTNPHRLRRHAVQVAVESSTEAGIPLEDVKLFTGHKSIETLKEYWDQNDTRFRMIAEAVASSNRILDILDMSNEVDI